MNRGNVIDRKTLSVNLLRDRAKHKPKKIRRKMTLIEFTIKQKRKKKKHDLGKFSAYSSALSLFESIVLSRPLTYGRNVRHMIDHSNSFIFA